MKILHHGLVLSLTLLLFSCQGDPQAKRDAYLESGQRYFEEESYPEALIQFRNVLQIDENFVPGRLALARTFQKVNDHQSALLQFQKAVELDGANVEARLELAGYFLLLGRQDKQYFSKAREFAQEILAADPSRIDARILLGNAFAGLQDVERSIQEMESILQEDPQNLTAYLNLGVFRLGLNDTENAEKAFLEAVEMQPDSWEAALALANFYTVTRDYEKAEQYFKRAFELGPEEKLNLLSLVGFYLVTQRPGEAEEVFQKARASNPGWKDPLRGLANFYLAQGKPEQAVQMLRSALEVDPQDRDVSIRLAELYLNLKRNTEAEGIVDTLLAQDTNGWEGHYLKGRLLLAKDERNLALEKFERSIQLNPRGIPAYIHKASVHLGRLEFARARDSLNEALRYDRTHFGARAGLAKILALGGSWQGALEQADAVLQHRPNNADALIARASALQGLERFDESVETFQKLLELRPESASFLQQLGAAELRRGNKSAALGYFSRALELEPDFEEAMNNIIFLYVKDKEYEGALAQVDQFMKKSSRQDMLHIFKGKIHIFQQDFARAEKEFRTAIEINPHNYGAYTQLGQLNLALGNLDQSVKEMDQLIEKNDRFAPAFFMKAIYLNLQGDISGALPNYERTLELNPNNPVALNNLAWIYSEQDQKLAQAVGLAQAARKSDPDNPTFAGTLGWVYYKLNNYTLAVNHLLFAVNNGQPIAVDYYRLGMAYYHKGDQTQALQTLRKALELDQSFPGAQEASSVLREIEIPKGLE